MHPALSIKFLALIGFFGSSFYCRLPPGGIGGKAAKRLRLEGGPGGARKRAGLKYTAPPARQ